jgi:molecular chaperone DnaK
MAKIIGIDLGTTLSVVTVMIGNEVKIIPNSYGSNLTPSVVAFTAKGERLVGIPAKRQQILNPKRTIHSIKRFIGRRRKEVTRAEKMVSYEVVGEPDELVKVKINNKLYTPQEISGFVLQFLKQDAERFLGEEIKDAVITCPAYFNEPQREATRDAGVIAGFNVRRVFPEPTASALAFGYGKPEAKKARKIAVYDLGGGTYDISILEVEEEVIQVLSINGNMFLGGDDFDARLVNFVADEFYREQGIDLRKDPQALQRLKDACERAKIDLSTLPETEINLPFIYQKEGVPYHLSTRITRSQFENLIRDLVESTIPPMEEALKDAGLKPADLDEILFVGGSSRVPLVSEVIKKKFGKEPNRTVHPDEAVGLGAGIQAAIIAGETKSILLVDVNPLTLGVEVLGGLKEPLIDKNTPIPIKKSKIFTTAQDGQTAVEVHVVQGEREMAADCRSLGRFMLEGIMPAPRGIPQIEVTFDMDVNGILHVTAKDKGTGKEQTITIKGSTGLSKEEVDRMVKEAEKFAEQDKKRRELVEIKNQADNLIYHTKKMMKDFEAKLTSSEKDTINRAIDNLEKAKKEDDVQKIKKAMDELNQAFYPISTRLYQEAAKQQPPPEEKKKEEKKDKGDEGDIRDARYEVK